MLKTVLPHDSYNPNPKWYTVHIIIERATDVKVPIFLFFNGRHPYYYGDQANEKGYGFAASYLQNTQCEDAVAAALHFNGRRRRNLITYNCISYTLTEEGI